jgi:hypothetical protein
MSAGASESEEESDDEDLTWDLMCYKTFLNELAEIDCVLILLAIFVWTMKYVF